MAGKTFAKPRTPTSGGSGKKTSSSLNKTRVINNKASGGRSTVVQPQGPPSRPQPQGPPSRAQHDAAQAIQQAAAAALAQRAQPAAAKQYDSAPISPAASRSPGLTAGPGAQSYSPPAYTPPPPVPQVTAPPTTPQVVPTPQITTGPGSQNTTGRSFTTVGGGTAGAFKRQRENRGPRTGLSMTPDLVRRLAAQRFSQG